MTFRKYHRNFTIGTSLLIIVIIIQISLTAANRNRFEAYQELQHKAILLSFEMVQSSDLLTSLARDYVMTQDSQYMVKYYEVLDVRNGVRARSDGRVIPFRKLLDQLELTTEETALLKLSEDNSNQLAKLEIKAFSIIQGATVNDLGESLGSDAALARKLVYSKEYIDSKKSIMAPIGEFEHEVLSRISKSLRKEARIRYVYFATSGLALLVLFIWIYVFILRIRKKVLNPLSHAEAVAKEVESGNFNSRWEESNNDNEIGNLASSFNNMLDRVNEANEELKVSIDNAMSSNAQLNSQNISLNQMALVSVTDAKGTILRANDLFCKVSQYSQKEMIGANHRIINSGYHDKETWADMYEHLSDGKTWRKTLKNKAKDGSFYWVDSIMAPIYYDNEKPLEYLAIRFVITERKKIEEELLLTQFGVDNAADAVWWIEPETASIIRANETGLNMLGYTKQDLVNLTIPTIDPYYPLEKWVLLVESLKKGEESSFESVHRRKDGSELPIEISAKYVKYESREFIVAFSRDITERKKIEEELAKSEEQFSSIVANVPGIIFRCLIDENWTMLFISEQVEEISGYPAESFMNNKERSYADLIVPEDLEKVQHAVAEKVKVREKYAVEYRITKADGEERWVKSQGQAVYDDHGEIKWLDGAIIDITDQKQAELEIEKISILSDNALELTKAGFWYIDFSIEGKFHSSARATNIFGMEKVEDEMYLIDDWFANVVKGDEKISEYVGEQFEGAIEGKYPTYDVEYPFYRPVHDDIIWIHAVGHVVRDVDGNALHMHGVVQDINDKKIAEKELEHINFMSDKALELTNAGFWHVDFSLDGIFNSSDRATEIFGLEKTKDNLYLISEWFGNVVKGDAKISEHVGEQFAGTIEGKYDIYDVEYPFYRPIYNDTIWLRAVGYVARNDSGKALHMYGVVQNIHESKLNQLALVEAKKEAESATEAKSSFLANMSHEIRTPMNAIIGFSHLIQKTELDEKQEDYVHKIESSSKSLLGIINDILDFSKIEAGKLTIENTDFDLENVFQDLANIITFKAHEKSLEVVFGISSKVPTYLNGDPLRLGQILTNLSNNAIKFTAAGEIVISADLVSEDEETVIIQFSVKDSGIGIEQDKISELFESFTQADTSTSRKFGGTGLGLTISRNLVELMDGKIWAESEFGHGSEFKFTMKLNKQKEGTKALVPSTDLRGLKVMVVDDNEASRDILQNALESFTFNVTTVESGQKGIDILKQPTDSPFELVLMDWNMPEMDGLTASEIILHDKGISKIPMIMMVTAYGKEEVFKKSEELGLASLLIKPVRYSYLFDTIMSSFGQSVKRVAVASNKMNEGSAELDQIRGAQILLAEDNLANQQVATELLESAGFIITVANNGLEVLKHLKQKPDFDIILMDLQMPEMGGYEATERIREKPELKNLPIVAMTADAMEGVKDKCFKVGMNDFLTKPIDPSLLFTALLKWIKAGERDVVVSKSKETENIELPDIASINTEEALARVGGNKKLFLKLITDFVNINEGLLQAIFEKLESNEEETAHRMIHTLKGTAGNLGMMKMHQLTTSLEKDLNEKGWDQFLKLNKALSVELTNVIDSIKKALFAEDVEASQSNGIDVSIMAKLATLLENDDPEAIDIFDSMGSIEDPLFQDLKEKVNGYDFEEALEVLLKLKKLI